MITIYGHQRCGYCKKAKQLAEKYNLEYEFKDTDMGNNLADLKAKKPDVKTVPQIWWDENYIGGYDMFSSIVEKTLKTNE